MSSGSRKLSADRAREDQHAASLRRVVPLYRHFAEFSNAAAALREHLGVLEGLRVLEAGCGAQSNLDLRDCEVTGIDISPTQLARNHALVEKVCADLQTYENEAWRRRFDLIVCWDVLEHLASPRAVVERFGAWSKAEGGRLVIVGPNVRSLKVSVTKHTPYFLHRLFYKLTIGTPLKAAGGAHEPFKTVFATDVRPENLLALLEANSFVVTLFVSFESFQNKWIKKFVPARAVDALNRAFFGSLKDFADTAATDFVIVAEHGVTHG